MSIAISGSSITFPDQTQMSTATGGSFRNRIINGDMRIDQRNAGSVVTVNTGSPSYTLDRWVAYQNSPSTGVQVSRTTTVPSGFQNSIKWGRNGSGTAGGVTVLAQALETTNCIDAQGGNVTLSFYAKAGANFSAASSQIGVTVISGTGTDQSVGSMVTFAWTGSATPISSTATLTTSWQRFTFTSTTLGASVSQLGVYLNWTTVGSAGADDNVYITGVQLEAGSTATEFERRPIGVELALCQRYYQKSYGQSVAPGTSVISTYNGIVFSNGVSDGATVQVIPFSVPLCPLMRSTPSLAYWDVNGNVSKFSTFTAGGFIRTDNQGGFGATFLTSNALIAGYGVPAVGSCFGFAFAASSEL